LALRLPRRAALAAIAAVAALACGSARLAAIDRGAYAGPPGTAVSGRAVVLEQPRPSRFGSSAVVRMTSGRAAGVQLLARGGGRTRDGPRRGRRDRPARARRLPPLRPRARTGGVGPERDVALRACVAAARARAHRPARANRGHARADRDLRPAGGRGAVAP